MTTKEMKAWIDKASYVSLLKKWRFEPSGSPWFEGEVAKYYEEVMFKKKLEIGDAAAVRASKDIGWG